MRVFGYARVSTKEQVKSGSLNQQVEKIKNYCDSQDNELVELFTDAGVSALKERPQFEKMMETIEDGKSKNKEVDGIVVTKLDRFGRSVKDLVMNMETLQEEEIGFISTGDSLDTSTPNGKLLFHILSAFAEFEREIIRERMQAGRESAKAEGKKLHRPKNEKYYRLPKKKFHDSFSKISFLNY